MVLRAKPEKKEEKERVRLALLRSTLRLAAAHGFASLGLREVSREAEIAPTSFYRHFADMEELGLALVRELVSPLIAGWGERMRAAARTQEDVMIAALDAVLEGVRDDPELTRFMVTERVGASVPLRRALRAELAALSNALELALRAASARTTKPASAAVLDAVVVLLLEAVVLSLELGDEDRSALRARVLEQLSRLLRLEERMS